MKFACDGFCKVFNAWVVILVSILYELENGCESPSTCCSRRPDYRCLLQLLAWRYVPIAGRSGQAVERLSITCYSVPPHIQSGIDPSTKSLGLTTKFDWAKGKFVIFSSMYEVDSDLFQGWLTASHLHIDTGTMKLFFALQHHYDNPLHLFNDLQSYGMWVLSWHGRHWRKCWLVHILLLLLLLLLFCSFFIQEKSCSENLTG